jgi:hypothetical protein
MLSICFLSCCLFGLTFTARLRIPKGNKSFNQISCFAMEELTTAR